MVTSTNKEAAGLADPEAELDADLLSLKLNLVTFGMVPEDFISPVFIQNAGDFCLSSNPNRQIRLSILSESKQVFHLIIEKSASGQFGVRGLAYGAATTIGELLYNLREPQVDILTSILDTKVVMRCLISRKGMEGRKILSDENILSTKVFSDDGVYKYYQSEVLIKYKINKVVLKQAVHMTATQWNQIMFDELRVALVSDHKHLPIRSVIGAVVTGTGYLIYDCIPGNKLDDFIALNIADMDVAMKIRLCHAICSVMSELHMADIYHGAPSAEDFYVKIRKNQKYNVRVLFNGAAGLLPKSVSKQIESAADYSVLAPEVTWTRTLTSASGVYSLGKLISNVMGAGTIDDKDLNAFLLPEITSIVSQCLVERPTDRPTMDGVFMNMKPIVQAIKEGCASDKWKIY